MTPPYRYAFASRMACFVSFTVPEISRHAAVPFLSASFNGADEDEVAFDEDEDEDDVDVFVAV